MAIIPQDIANTIVDPTAYADGDRIDQAFIQLRREAPLALAHPEGFDPLWAVTRHADIQAVERQNDLFHNGDRSATLTTIEGDRLVRQMTGGSPHLVKSLVQMDNPDHAAYRRLTQGAFLPQNLRDWMDEFAKSPENSSTIWRHSAVSAISPVMWRSSTHCE